MASYPMVVGVPAAVGHDVRVAPTVSCTARWGQIPVAVGHDGRM
jgi:hypothetical protein